MPDTDQYPMWGRKADGSICAASDPECVVTSEPTADTSGYADAEPEITHDNVEAGAPRVRLKWYTPRGDQLLAHMARVSNPKVSENDPSDRLIAFLLKSHHWSPFEMVNLCLEIHTERDISAQILRHRSFTFQEFSTRYAEVEELRYGTECRFQDHKNRQNSFEVADVADEVNGHPIDATTAYFDAVVNESRVRSMEAYQELLRRGVAKEVARRVLPIGLMPTILYMNGNLRSWITYIMERTKPGVQKEHRTLALAVEPILAQCFPLVSRAVAAYRADEGKTAIDRLVLEVQQQRGLEPCGTEPLDLIKAWLEDA